MVAADDGGGGGAAVVVRQRQRRVLRMVALGHLGRGRSVHQAAVLLDAQVVAWRRHRAHGAVELCVPRRRVGGGGHDEDVRQMCARKMRANLDTRVTRDMRRFLFAYDKYITQRCPSSMFTEFTHITYSTYSMVLLYARTHLPEPIETQQRRGEPKGEWGKDVAYIGYE